jgi:hypothetical protein
MTIASCERMYNTSYGMCAYKTTSNICVCVKPCVCTTYVAGLQVTAARIPPQLNMIGNIQPHILYRSFDQYKNTMILINTHFKYINLSMKQIRQNICAIPYTHLCEIAMYNLNNCGRQ